MHNEVEGTLSDGIAVKTCLAEDLRCGTQWQKKTGTHSSFRNYFVPMKSRTVEMFSETPAFQTQSIAIDDRQVTGKSTCRAC